MATKSFVQLPTDITPQTQIQASFIGEDAGQKLGKLSSAMTKRAKTHYKVLKEKYANGKIGSDELIKFVAGQWNSARDLNDKEYWERVLIDTEEGVRKTEFKKKDLEVQASYERGEIGDQEYWNALNNLKVDAEAEGDELLALRYDLKIAKFEDKVTKKGGGGGGGRRGGGGGGGASQTATIKAYKDYWNDLPQVGDTEMEMAKDDLDNKFQSGEITADDHDVGMKNWYSLKVQAENGKLQDLRNFYKEGLIKESKFNEESEKIYKKLGFKGTGETADGEFAPHKGAGGHFQPGLLQEYQGVLDREFNRAFADVNKLRLTESGQFSEEDLAAGRTPSATPSLSAERLSERFKTLQKTRDKDGNLTGNMMNLSDIYLGEGKDLTYYTSRYWQMPSTRETRALSGVGEFTAAGTDISGIPSGDTIREFAQRARDYEKDVAIKQLTRPGGGGYLGFVRGDTFGRPGPTRRKLELQSAAASAGANAFVGQNRLYK